MEHIAFPSWPDVAARLIAVASGREMAETVIRGGIWVNVHSRELLPNHDIAIVAGRVACVVPDASYCTGPETQIIEAEGRYMMPGLCDAHMHIESGMLTPAEFSRAVIPHGTTSMFTDPHEIANVLGLAGVRMMHDEAMLQPVNVFTQMPSCAPSAPGLETTGYEISAEDPALPMPTPRCWPRSPQPSVQARRWADTMPRPTLGLTLPPMLRAVRQMTTKAQVRPTRSCGCVRGCVR